MCINCSLLPEIGIHLLDIATKLNNYPLYFLETFYVFKAPTSELLFTLMILRFYDQNDTFEMSFLNAILLIPVFLPEMVT